MLRRSLEMELIFAGIPLSDIKVMSEEEFCDYYAIMEYRAQKAPPKGMR